MPIAFVICVLHEKIENMYYTLKGVPREYTPGTPGVFILACLVSSVFVLIGMPILVYYSPTVGGAIAVVWISISAFFASKLGFI